MLTAIKMSPVIDREAIQEISRWLTNRHDKWCLVRCQTLKRRHSCPMGFRRARMPILRENAFRTAHLSFVSLSNIETMCETSPQLATSSSPRTGFLVNVVSSLVTSHWRFTIMRHRYCQFSNEMSIPPETALSRPSDRTARHGDTLSTRNKAVAELVRAQRPLRILTNPATCVY